MDKLKIELGKAIVKHQILREKKLKLDAETSLAYMEVKDIRSNIEDAKVIEIKKRMYNLYKKDQDRKAIDAEVKERIGNKLATIKHYKSKCEEYEYLIKDIPEDKLKSENIRLRRLLTQANKNIETFNNMDNK